MLGVKAAFDPAGTAQPGQGDPDAARAAPSTASMHVKKGLLPFPELERF